MTTTTTTIPSAAHRAASGSAHWAEVIGLTPKGLDAWAKARRPLGVTASQMRAAARYWQERALAHYVARAEEQGAPYGHAARCALRPTRWVSGADTQQAAYAWRRRRMLGAASGRLV